LFEADAGNGEGHERIGFQAIKADLNPRVRWGGWYIANMSFERFASADFPGSLMGFKKPLSG
jgi:hypothetical protein